MARGDISVNDTYLEKTSKLIPGEALAIFIALSSTTWAAAGVDDPTKRIFVAVLALCVALIAIPLILYRLRVTSVGHYVVSVFAFLVWVVNVQYDRLPFYPDEDGPYVLGASLLLAIVTFLAPLLMPARQQVQP